jgi:hypothetical protein
MKESDDESLQPDYEGSTIKLAPATTKSEIHINYTTPLDSLCTSERGVGMPIRMLIFCQL